MILQDRLRRQRPAVLADPCDEVCSKGAHPPHVDLIEASHSLSLQPAQKRQDRLVVVAQRLRREQLTLPIQPEVLVADDKRRLPANRYLEFAITGDPNRVFHSAHIGLPCNG